jgi:hypothetical protein
VKEGGIGLLDLDSGVLKKINQQIHRITKHMLKKIKTEIDRKKNHTWCELGHDSRSGVKEGGTSLLDLDSGVKKKKQPTNTQNHKVYAKIKIKIKIDRKKKSYLV